MNIHLAFYEKRMQSGSLPITSGGGLCNCAREGLLDIKKLKMFEPTEQDWDQLFREELSHVYWGCELNINKIGLKEEGIQMHGFTTLRQTVVLFMAFLNDDELE